MHTHWCSIIYLNPHVPFDASKILSCWGITEQLLLDLILNSLFVIILLVTCNCLSSKLGGIPICNCLSTLSAMLNVPREWWWVSLWWLVLLLSHYVVIIGKGYVFCLCVLLFPQNAISDFHIMFLACLYP